MNLENKELLKAIEETQEYKVLFKSLLEGKKCSIVADSETFHAIIISSFFKNLSGNMLIICSSPEDSDTLFSNIRTFSKNLLYVPERETHLPPQNKIEEKEVLRIKSMFSVLSSKNNLIVTNIPALSIPLPSKERFPQSFLRINTNYKLKRDDFIRLLFSSGYEEAALVENPGEFARRGSIVDFYPYEDRPVRIEFLGDIVSSIRYFDVFSQSSTEKIKKYNLLPLSEDFIQGEKTSILTDVLDPEFIFLFNPDNFYTIYEKMADNAHPEFRKIFIDVSYVFSLSASSLYYRHEKSLSGKVFFFPVETPSGFRISNDRLLWNRREDENVYVFEENNLHVENVRNLLQQHEIDTGKVNFCPGYISTSFTFPSANVTVLNASHVLGFKKQKQSSYFFESVPIARHQELKNGDYIVHYQEGIGRFIGIERIHGHKEEMIALEYAGGDKLYLPLSQIDFIQKYIGSGAHPNLSKLKSTSWIKAREKVRGEIFNLADELYNVYTERKKNRGFKYPVDDEIQVRLEEEFPYQETADQLKAVEEIKKDLESDKIMDRLLCGDSGYGKTEVAIRAALKVVRGDRQAALLCPTTVLAQQHLRTFRERMQALPVEIDMLSRLYSAKKQKEVISRIKEGKIDIVIGTHRLIQDDVEFKNPGILIIDEEQKFGVLHKEKIKKRFKDIEVLTLSATPIPRTLYFSLSGIRDLSIIETPPAGRMSVFTYIGRYDKNLVRRVILKEIERGGQIFYLHNRIYDIENVKKNIESMFPGIPAEIAHGRMDERNLSRVMEDFAKDKIKILIATSIVENGLDVPNANTLIVDNAHLFGLSDLYQLRGRVGRYKVRAYAYFLVPPHVYAVKDVKERLGTLSMLTNPGSGFKVAMMDLHQRGAGDILGKKQHGFINQVGFNLYCQFWKEVSARFTGREIRPPSEKSLMKGAIDPQWLPDDGLRFSIYREISEIENMTQAQKLITELRDRFGKIPNETKKLILNQIKNQ
ncbi:MAG: DEAD/DEAH box helicase [Candidatus Omnitrophica bacterium]|nr:DEAD/DEAH box helicase [Candidatus Omnitrophota bacterium]